MADPFGKNAGRVTIKGGKTSAAQRAILARAIRYAEKARAPYKAKVALITALIQESEAKNLSTPSADGYGSYGVLQGREKYHSRKNLMNPEYQFSVFLGTNKKWKKGFTSKGNAIELSKTGMKSGQIAQAVEGSAYPDRYQTTSKEAQRILRLYGSGSGGGGGGQAAPSTGGTSAPSSMDTNAANLQALYQYARNRNKGAKLSDLAKTVSDNNAAAQSMPVVTPTAPGAVSKAPKAAKVSKAPKSSASAGSIYELFHDPQGGWKFGKRIAPIGGHGGHVHVAADERRVKWVGKQAQKMGLRVAEHRAFSGSTPRGGHAPNSYHYKNQAIDVSGDAQKMADFTRWVRRNYNLQK